MFRTPSNILVVGPSGSGKTVFVSELLKEPHWYFRPVPKHVHYCYWAMQPLLQTLRRLPLKSCRLNPNPFWIV